MSVLPIDNPSFVIELKHQVQPHILFYLRNNRMPLTSLIRVLVHIRCNFNKSFQFSTF